MNTTTPTPRTCGELSCEECNARTAELTAERDQLRAQLHALNLVCGTTDADKFSTWVDRAYDRALRAEAEVERLRSDRGCEKRLRKDADEFRENAIARAERAEASLHALRLVCGTTDADKFATWVDRAIARAEKAEAELATERARLDAVIYDCWIIHKGNDYAYAVRSLGEYITPWVATPRAAIDAAMKEGGK